MKIEENDASTIQKPFPNPHAKNILVKKFLSHQEMADVFQSASQSAMLMR